MPCPPCAQGSPHVVFEMLGLNDDEEGQKMAERYKHELKGIALSRNRYIRCLHQAPACLPCVHVCVRVCVLVCVYLCGCGCGYTTCLPCVHVCV